MNTEKRDTEMEKSGYEIMGEFTDAATERYKTHAYAAGYLEQLMGDILSAKDARHAQLIIESCKKSIVKITEEMNAHV